MEAVENMMKEHQQILAVLDALDRFATSERDLAADKAELGRFVTFIREYADARHHGKEENVLFEAMTRHGFPREQGPVAVMLHEHEQMRKVVGAMRGLAEQAAPWTQADRARLAEAALSYTGTLRHHIMKENEILYPMAMHHLPPPVQERIDQECAALDARRASAGTDATLEELAAGLTAKYAGVPS